MHKPLKRFYNYLTKIMDRKINKMDVKKKEREAELKEIYPDWDPNWDLGKDKDLMDKLLGMPPLDAKNPYRFL